MLNELENKIRKEIPELYGLNYNNQKVGKQIQLNHVLMYLNSKGETIETYNYRKVLRLWNLKSNLLSEQPIELIKYILELKK